MQDLDAWRTEAAVGIGVRSGILIAGGEQIAGEWFGEESADGVCEQVEFELPNLQGLQLFRERFMCVFDAVEDGCTCQLDELADGFVWCDVVAVVRTDQLNLMKPQVVQACRLCVCRGAVEQWQEKQQQTEQPATVLPAVVSVRGV